MLLTRLPLYLQDCSRFLVRLACVRHAASVDSEPGSNSPFFLNEANSLPSRYVHLAALTSLGQDLVCPSYLLQYFQFLESIILARTIWFSKTSIPKTTNSSQRLVYSKTIYPSCQVLFFKFYAFFFFPSFLRLFLVDHHPFSKALLCFSSF